MEFKLLSLEAGENGMYRVRYSGPLGDRYEGGTVRQVVGEAFEEVDPFQVHRALDFWRDRQVETVGSDDPEDPEPQAQLERARLGFLSSLFPEWPTDRGTLLDFARRTGKDLGDGADSLPIEQLWQILFGQAPPILAGEGAV